MKFIPCTPPLGSHGVGWARKTLADAPDIRVLAMGVVKPANDDEEFWRLKMMRDYMADYVLSGCLPPPGPSQ